MEIPHPEQNNVHSVCPHCVKAKQAEWQEANKDTEIKVGMYVKLKFIDHDQSEDDNPPAEYMWVEITHIEDHELIGRLDNEPFGLVTWSLNDELRFRKSAIITSL